MKVQDFIDLGNNSEYTTVFISNSGRKILTVYYTYNNLGKKAQEKLEEISDLKVIKITPKIGTLDKETKSKYPYLKVSVFGYEPDEKIAQQMWDYEQKEQLLTEGEKKYLSQVIKPYTGHISFIRKMYKDSYCLDPIDRSFCMRFELHIILDHDGEIVLPFDNKEFQKLEPNNAYYLEELGIE